MDTKKCARCKKTRIVTDFYKKKFVPKTTEPRPSGYYKSQCKECMSEASKYAWHHEGVKERRLPQGKLYRIENKDKLSKARRATMISRISQIADYLKQHPCVDCGETNIIVLQFDHRNRAQKNGNISTMLSKRPMDQVMLEIEKCDVRCANCHTMKTAREVGWHMLQFV